MLLNLGKIPFDTYSQHIIAKFTENNAFLIAKIKPKFDETRKAKIGKKKPEEMPKDSFAIAELGLYCYL